MVAVCSEDDDVEMEGFPPKFKEEDEEEEEAEGEEDEQMEEFMGGGEEVSMCGLTANKIHFVFGQGSYHVVMCDSMAGKHNLT